MRNPRSLQGWSVLALLWSVQAALGCAAGGPPPEAPDSPRIDGLSTVRVAVGERLELFGSGLPERSDGWADVQFVGEFRAADGTTSAVDFTVPLLAGEPGVLAWQSFGAYRIPFGDGL